MSDVSYMICEIAVYEMNNVLSYDCECLGDGLSVIPAEKAMFLWKQKWLCLTLPDDKKSMCNVYDSFHRLQF
jgi:hypothetical protein